jgi:uncharacterized phiE125 gp8 family phage protein
VPVSAEAIPAEVIAAAAEAIADHLRTTGNAEAELVARLAASAIELAEAFTGMALIARMHEERLRAGAAWQSLSAVPVRAITAVAWAADEVPVPPSGHAIDIDADARGWVRLTGGAAEVTVRYRAGLAEGWEQLPAPIAHGIAALAAHWHADREGRAAPPAAIAALWRPWRRMALNPPRRAAAAWA